MKQNSREFISESLPIFWIFFFCVGSNLIQPLSCSGLVVRVLILRLKNRFSCFKSVLKF